MKQGTDVLRYTTPRGEREGREEGEEEREREREKGVNVSPLKIVVMSATLDADSFAKYFNAKVLSPSLSLSLSPSLPLSPSEAMFLICPSN